MAKSHGHPAHRKAFKLTQWDMEVVCQVMRDFNPAHYDAIAKQQLADLKRVIGDAKEIVITPF